MLSCNFLELSTLLKIVGLFCFTVAFESDESGLKVVEETKRKVKNFWLSETFCNLVSKLQKFLFKVRGIPL